MAEDDAATSGGHDEDARVDFFSSISTPTTTSPTLTPFNPLADLSSTPLSATDDGVTSLGMVNDPSSKTMTPAHPAKSTISALEDALQKPETNSQAETLTCVGSKQTGKSSNTQNAEKQANMQSAFQSQPNLADGPSVPRGQEYEIADKASTTTTASHPHTMQTDKSANTASSPPDNEQQNSSWPVVDPPPLRVGSVQPGTKIAHPKPISRPTSNASNLPLKHPLPDLTTRSGVLPGNVAQLEATAAQLSMTSSIDDAIRELHGELKRSDSKRSAALAASLRGASIDDTISPEPVPISQLKRHTSNASSIVSTNIAARHGGYSPAAFVMSPSHSLTNRLRSGSKTSTGQPELDFDPPLPRHGPGKASIRSVRSAKMSLQEISESEPISLTQQALDAADKAPTIEEDDHNVTPRLEPFQMADINATDDFHKMLGESFADTTGFQVGAFDPAAPIHQPPQPFAKRPGSSHSDSTFLQAENAFIDFDGVHWEEELTVPPELEPQIPQRRPSPKVKVRPQSYMDPETGQHMLYYPARVPAMINLPPKLSAKPKAAAQRTNRQSQMLGDMVDENRRSFLPEISDISAARSGPANRRSELPGSGRKSWLPEVFNSGFESLGQLPSFGFEEPETQPTHEDEPLVEPETTAETQPLDGLRRPQRLSRNPLDDHRKSRMSQLNSLPPQVRASAFFDLPPTPPEVEAKDGSAMDALESILDASARAPVSAFTDHAFAGKLGSEVYGKQKKRKSRAPAATLRVVPPEDEPTKKRSSFAWLGKRSSSYNSDDKNNSRRSHSVSALGMHHDQDDAESQALTSSVDGESALHHEHDLHVEEQEEEDEEEESEEEYDGPPTTLLAELQLRKKDQKRRTQHLTQAFPNGMHATLLEMDAVAETQRKAKLGKRVNLAWEDPDEHYDQNGSSDEDTPLALIAAKHQGAKNLADVDRRIGLMEQRDLEENEPLSQRRARLQGLEPPLAALIKRQSVMSLSGTRMMRGPSPAIQIDDEPELSEGEIEGETLGERKRRLEAEDEAEGRLPRARPVSSTFSAELLSQFGDPEEPKEQDRKDSTTPNNNGEEETLGQRRRRLQAEREARELEMGFNNGGGKSEQQATRRLSMANMLAAHPRRDNMDRSLQAQQRQEEERRMAMDQDTKMAALRAQMPTSLVAPNVERAGGFRGGAYNDGNGGGAGRMLQAAHSTPMLHGPGLSPYNNMSYHNNRASVALSNFGPQVQQPAYGGVYGYGAMNGGGSVANLNYAHPYGNAGQAGMMQQPNMMQQASPMYMQMPMSSGSVDRVERWRQSVLP